MKKNWVLLTLGCVIVLSTVLSQAEDVNEQMVNKLMKIIQMNAGWRGRAEQAVKELDALEKEMENKDSLTIRYKIMLEFAYGAFLTMPETLIKKDSVVTSYHIVLNYGDDGLFNVLYNYDNKTDKLVSVSIDRLPKNRRIAMFPDLPNAFFIHNPSDTKEPMIAFSTKEPLEAFVVEK